MLQSFPYTVLVTALALFVYAFVTLKVAISRTSHKVMAPAVGGSPEFERALRVQMNTLEQLAIFLPGLWLFAASWGDHLAAAIGIIWPIARIFYARGYYIAAEKRGPGFGASFFTGLILLLGAVVSAVQHLL